MQTVIYMKEIGKMIKPTGEEYTCIQMELSIRGNGKMISNMGMGLNHGLMGRYMRDNIVKERKMEKEN